MNSIRSELVTDSWDDIISNFTFPIHGVLCSNRGDFIPNLLNGKCVSVLIHSNYIICVSMYAYDVTSFVNMTS